MSHLFGIRIFDCTEGEPKSTWYLTETVDFDKITQIRR